jgi:hypothetical protein
MNIQQKQTVLTQIETFYATELTKKLSEKFASETDFQKASVGGYTVSDFQNYLNRVFKQLEFRLSEELWNILPANQNFHNDFGDCDLIRDINQIIEFINANNFDSIITTMERLIYYEKANGFWEITKVKDKDVNEFASKIIEQKSTIDLHLNQAIEFAKQVTVLTTDIQNLKTGFNEFQTQKINELTEVAKNLESSRVQLTELTENLNKAKVNEVELSGILKTQQEKLNESTTSLQNIVTEFEKFKTESELQKTEFKNDIDRAKLSSDESKKLYDFIIGKKDDIVRLTGMAADGSLGSKFHEKEGRLSKYFWVWQALVPITTAVTAFWVFCVFHWLYTSLEPKWIEIILNSLKTAPAFVLLGWVMSQYTKERNLQEDYAFKSAVAMTITSYSDLLNGSSSEKTNAKEKMILDSIKQVHTAPKLYSEKRSSIFGKSSKDLKETIGMVKEIMNNKPD